MPVAQNGRQRPLRDIIKELSDFIVETSEIHSPDTLVWKIILPKFNVEGKEKWYSGHDMSYSARTHLHEVSYDDEHQFFNLLEHISHGDLVINDQAVLQ